MLHLANWLRPVRFFVALPQGLVRRLRSVAAVKSSPNVNNMGNC